MSEESPFPKEITGILLMCIWHEHQPLFSLGLTINNPSYPIGVSVVVMVISCALVEDIFSV